jgi:hypothetical protein
VTPRADGRSEDATPRMRSVRAIGFSVTTLAGALVTNVVTSSATAALHAITFRIRSPLSDDRKLSCQQADARDARVRLHR